MACVFFTLGPSSYCCWLIGFWFLLLDSEQLLEYKSHYWDNFWRWILVWVIHGWVVPGILSTFVYLDNESIRCFLRYQFWLVPDLACAIIILEDIEMIHGLIPLGCCMKFIENINCNSGRNETVKNVVYGCRGFIDFCSGSDSLFPHSSYYLVLELISFQVIIIGLSNCQCFCRSRVRRVLRLILGSVSTLKKDWHRFRFSLIIFLGQLECLCWSWQRVNGGYDMSTVSGNS